MSGEVIYIIIVVLAILLLIFFIRYTYIIFFIPGKIKKAKELFLRKKERKALKLLSEVLSINRGNPEANWLMAEYYLKKRQYHIAKLYLTDIILFGRYNIEVPETKVRETLAYIYRKTGELSKALSQYFILLEKNIISMTELKNAIRICLNHNFFEEAREFIEKGKKLQPEDGEINYLKALLFFQKGDILKSEKELKIALKKGYKESEVYLLAGKINFIKGEYQKAINYFQKLPPEYFNISEIESLAGQSFYYLRNYEDAIRLLEKFIKEKGAVRTGYLAGIEYMLGCAYEKLGKIEKAIQIWENIKNYAPYFQPAGEKLKFYTEILRELKLQKLVVEPLSDFIDKVYKLLDKLNFVIREKINEKETLLEYLAYSTFQIQLVNSYYIMIVRETTPISIHHIRQALFLMRKYRAKNCVVIAPAYKPEAEGFARRNQIIFHDFTIFKKHKII